MHFVKSVGNEEENDRKYLIHVKKNLKRDE